MAGSGPPLPHTARLPTLLSQSPHVSTKQDAAADHRTLQPSAAPTWVTPLDTVESKGGQSSALLLPRSPATAYLRVRKLLDEVVRYEGQHMQAHLSTDGVSWKSRNRSASTQLTTEGGSAAPARFIRDGPSSQSSPAAFSEKIHEARAGARAVQRVRWLAQWTQNVLEAYPLIDDSGVSDEEHATMQSTRRAHADEIPDLSKAAVAAAAEASAAAGSSVHAIVCDAGARSGALPAEEQPPKLLEKAGHDVDTHDTATAGAPPDNKISAGWSGGEVNSGKDEHRGSSAEVMEPPVERQLSYVWERDPHDGPSSVVRGDALNEVRLSEVYAGGTAAAAVGSLLPADRSPPRTDGGATCYPCSMHDDGGDKESDSDAHRGATHMKTDEYFSVAAPPPPIIPRYRPPLCRTVGDAHDAPVTVAEQRASLRAQGCCCAHCGVVLAMPPLGLHEWWSMTWRAVCCAVSCRSRSRCCRCCAGCSASDNNGSSSGSDDEERVDTATFRSASRAARVDADDDTIRNDHRHPSLFSFTPGRAARGLTEGVNGSDGGDDANAEASVADEREGLLAQSRCTSSLLQRPKQYYENHRVRLSPHLSQEVVARRSKLASSLSATSADVAAAAAPVLQRDLADLNSAVTTAAPSIIAAVGDDPGALYCVYEGMWLCTTCFYSRAATTVVESLWNAERVVDADAWQTREDGFSTNHNRDDDNVSDDSAVGAGITQAAGRLHRWWMSRHLAGGTPHHTLLGDVTYLRAVPPALQASPPPQQRPQLHSVAAATSPVCCLIPAHVLRLWDFTRYPVSARAALVLQRLSAPPPPSSQAASTTATAMTRRSKTVSTTKTMSLDGPGSDGGGLATALPVLYDITSINPALYARVPSLAAASRLRKRMCLLHAHAWWCPRYRTEVWGVDRAFGRHHGDVDSAGVSPRLRRTKAEWMPPVNTDADRPPSPPAPPPPAAVVATKESSCDLVPPKNTRAAALSSIADAVPHDGVNIAFTLPATRPAEGTSVLAAAHAANSAAGNVTSVASEEEDDETEAAAFRWPPATPPRPRCPAKRRYLVERAEGWSLLDLYRLTTSTAVSHGTPASSATSSRLSERVLNTSNADHRLHHNDYSGSGVVAANPPSLMVELRSMYAVMQDHVSHCECCRVHCRGTSERE
jgi:hypothetical protein